MTASFIADLFGAVHETTDEYRLALYTEDSSLSLQTIDYTEAGEATGAGYEKGGFLLNSPTIKPGADGAALVFSDFRREVTTIGARFALIYNGSKDNASVALYDFGETVRSQNGPYVIPLSQGPLSINIRAT
jgi:hypothetical protein